MAVLVWSDLAVRHLQEICAFVAEDNPPAAIKLGERLVSKALLLEAFPSMGQEFRTTHNGVFRALHYGNYRILYQLVVCQKS